MVGRLASGGVVWQAHRHVVSNVHRRGAVDRRGARGSSRCLTLLWWLTRRAGRHIPPEGGGKDVRGPAGRRLGGFGVTLALLWVPLASLWVNSQIWDFTAASLWRQLLFGGVKPPNSWCALACSGVTLASLW